MKKIMTLLLVVSVGFIQGCQTMNSVAKNTGYDGLMNESDSKIQGYLYDVQGNLESDVTALDSVYYELQLLDSKVVGKQNKLKLEASKKRKQVHNIEIEINNLEQKSRLLQNFRNDIGQTQRDLKSYKDPIVRNLISTKDDLKNLSEVSSVTGKNILDKKTLPIKKLDPKKLNGYYKEKFELNKLNSKFKTLSK